MEPLKSFEEYEERYGRQGYDFLMPYVPLSVRHGSRRKRLAWWWLGRRETLALWIAPWL